ncbi:MAG: hypothetical protein QNJ46_32780 [Leptolyngbyaceae cyanobacterium MO_188.B28]|nr:hypothetical protein [Leptolyngbyaceae cyanobacterium MO_188.B28]
MFHNKRHPKDMGASEIRAHLSHLAISRNVAAATQTIVFWWASPTPPSIKILILSN